MAIACVLLTSIAIRIYVRTHLRRFVDRSISHFSYREHFVLPQCTPSPYVDDSVHEKMKLLYLDFSSVKYYAYVRDEPFEPY